MEVAQKLEKLWHTVIVPEQAQAYLNWEITGNDWTKKDPVALKKIWLASCDKIKDADCVLVTNYSKGDIDGYIGNATFMKMSIAFYLRKPIYLLNTLPANEVLKSVEEISVMQPIVIDGNLEKIN